MNGRPLVLAMEEAKNEITEAVVRAKYQTGLPSCILDGIISSILADIRKDACAEIAAAQEQPKEEKPEEKQDE